LRRFLALFGQHPLADAARLRLADELTKTNEWLAAEWELGQLHDRTDQSVAAEATARLARLAMLSGRNSAAVTYCRELKDRWPNSPCSEGRTGAELFAEASGAQSTDGSLRCGSPVAAGRVKVEEAPQGVNRQSYRRRFPVPLLVQAGPASQVSAVHV